MSEILIWILSFLVAILAVLQGWQMKKKRNNPNSFGLKLNTIISHLEKMEHLLGRMEQRLNDVWDKVKE